MISDRVAIKELCQTTLAAAFAESETLSAVRVFYGDPGEELGNEFIVLGDITGQAKPAGFGDRTQVHDDNFTIKCALETHQHVSAVAADRRAQDILDLVNATLFTTSFAQSLNGRVSPANQEGPNSTPALDGNPAASAVEFDIEISVSVR